MEMDDDQAVSSYLNHLPATFRQDPFAGRFLRAFETVLSGTGPDEPGLEGRIATVARYLDPARTESEFLPWLASWVALTLRSDWDVATRRSFIGRIVPLYGLRGTPEGLRRMLALYTGREVVVDDQFDQVPHFFQVHLTLRQADPGLIRRTQQIARAIIDQEKPAHTFYALQIATPTMRLVSRALQQRERDPETDEQPPLLVLGENTLLGFTNASL
jgi:phage tail-like protein